MEPNTTVSRNANANAPVATQVEDTFKVGFKTYKASDYEVHNKMSQSGDSYVIYVIKAGTVIDGKFLTEKPVREFRSNEEISDIKTALTVHVEPSRTPGQLGWATIIS